MSHLAYRPVLAYSVCICITALRYLKITGGYCVWVAINVSCVRKPVHVNNNAGTYFIFKNVNVRSLNLVCCYFFLIL